MFGLFHGVRKANLDLYDHDFLIMMKKKLEVRGNIPVTISKEYKRELTRQLEGQLRPVLRPGDFHSFNLDEAFELIGRVDRVISGGAKIAAAIEALETYPFSSVPRPTRRS